MKLRINTDIIRSFRPCKDRFDNWLMCYDAFDDDVLEFLNLDKISATDKIWVAVRVLPREAVEIFAIDCAFSAAAYAAYADAAYAAAYADAAYAAAYDAAVYAAVYAAAAERKNQVDALIWLIENDRKAAK